MEVVNQQERAVTVTVTGSLSHCWPVLKPLLRAAIKLIIHYLQGKRAIGWVCHFVFHGI